MSIILEEGSTSNALEVQQFEVSFDWPISRVGRSDGLPTGQVHDTAFDSHGRLWMATPNGLARSDGSRVVTFARSDGLSSHGLRCVAVAPDGIVWMGSDVGVDRMLIDATVEPGFGGWQWGLANDLAIGTDGTAWVASAGGLIRWTSTTGWTRDDSLLPSSSIDRVCLDRAGRVWISSRQFGVLVRTETGWAHPAADVQSLVGTVLCLGATTDGSMLVGGTTGAANIDVAGRIVRSIPPIRGAVHAARASDGELWIGTGDRLLRLEASETAWTDRSVVIDGTRINAIDIDGHGNVWAASDGDGIAKIEATRHAIRRPDLPVGAVFALRPDETGDLLVAGDRVTGVYSADEPARFTPIPALTGEKVWDIWDAGDGVVWAAAESGLVKVVDGIGECVHADHPVLGSPARVLLERGDGLWVGTLNGLARINGDGSVTVISDDAGASLGYVYTLQSDGGSVWIGTLGNGLWLSRRSGLQRIVGDGISATGNTYAIAVAIGEGTPTVVLQDDRAVTVEDDGTTNVLATASGSIMGWTAALDERGSLWVGGSDGLTEYNVRTGDVRQRITLCMGVDGWEFTTSRSLIVGHGGALFCGLNSGLAIVNRDDLARVSSHAPTAELSSVHWTNVTPSVSHDGSFIVPHGRWTVEASVFSTNAFDEATQLYRYRLLGFEATWSEPTAAAHTQFSSLPPGSYTLEAQAHSAITGWGAATSLAAFEVRRHRSLRTWTRERRSTQLLRRLAGENHGLEQRVRERTMELTAARDQLELANQALAKLSHTDPLTDIANRRHFDARLKIGLEEVVRRHSPLSLLVADVDDFKAYNDLFGHIAGDACLQQIAGIMSRSVRDESDLLARYGGEEFALLLPSTDAATAMEIADRLRHEIEEAALANPNSSAADVVTVTVGVATVLGGRAAHPGDLIGQADRALYAAKRSGRNCCQAAPDHVED